MPIREKIRQFILSELIADGSQPDLHDSVQLIDAGIIDSFGIMALLGFLEESFSLQISGDDLLPENFASIATISEFIALKNHNPLEASCEF